MIVSDGTSDPRRRARAEWHVNLAEEQADSGTSDCALANGLRVNVIAAEPDASSADVSDSRDESPF